MTMPSIAASENQARLCWPFGRIKKIASKGPKDEPMSFQTGPGLAKYVQVSVPPSGHGL